MLLYREVDAWDGVGDINGKVGIRSGGGTWAGGGSLGGGDGTEGLTRSIVGGAGGGSKGGRASS